MTDDPIILHITSGPRAGEQLQIAQKTTLGREGTDVVFGDDEASRRHVAVRPVTDGLEVEDLGSLNGTRVDGRQIEAVVVVGSGSTVSFGATSLTVELPVAETVADPGATRLAAPVVDPGATRVTAPVVDPGRTRVKPSALVPGAVEGDAAAAARAEAAATPSGGRDVTRVRAREVTDGGSPAPAQTPPSERTVIRSRATGPQADRIPGPSRRPDARDRASAVDSATPAFAASVRRRRRRGVASRLYTPALVAMLAVAATAAALVIYLGAS